MSFIRMICLCCPMKPYASLQNMVNGLACCMFCVCLVSICMSSLNQKHSGCQKIQLAFKSVSYRLIKQKKNFTLTSCNIWCLQIAPPAVEIPLEMTGCIHAQWINPYPTAFPYGNGMVLHFYQQQESSTTKTVHKVINKGLKTYV